MTRHYVEQFDEFLTNGARNAPAPVNALRRRAIDQFVALGFPTMKNEDWHFTSVAPIAEREFSFVAARTGDVGHADLEAFGFGGDDWHTAVFVNGRFAPELSTLTRLDPGVFWRVHRSHLVNINKIKEIVPWFSRNYILKMKDAKGTEIPVSRSQTRRLREYLKL